MESKALGTEVQLTVEPQMQQELADAWYQESVQHFQEGRWQDAMAGFEKVLQLRPEHTEARVFLEEARLKASLDQRKPKPRQFRFQGTVKYFVWSVLALGLVLFLALGALWVYNRWIEPTTALQQTELEKVQQLQKAYKHMAEQDYAAAEEAFQFVLATDPTNQEAQEGLAETRQRSALADKYNQVQQAIAAEDWSTALSLLTEIMQLNPSYKDVQAQQAFVQRRQQWRTLLNEAEEAYQAGNWLEANAVYEQLRTMDAEYEKQTVTAHLFESYLKQGIYLVESTKGKSEAVREAMAFYQKALELQPQEPQAVQQMALAGKYLEAETRLAQADLPGAVAALEWVCRQQPDYAGGNAAALLKTTTAAEIAAEPTPTTGAATAATGPAPAVAGSFREQLDVSLNRGDSAAAAGEYAQAAQAYREAVLLAVHTGKDSARWLFACHAKLAAALAKGAQYAPAVDAVKTSIDIMVQSAAAIPAELYADSVAEGDRYTQAGDYQKALAQYDKAVQVFGVKCNCGLENWSVAP